MMRLLYTLAIWLYHLAHYPASIFSKKARLRLGGLRAQKRIALANPENKRVWWFHCASLGEFEQARPVMEQLKSQSDVLLVVSFFSSSGYEVRRNFPLCDAVIYLPPDLPWKMQRLCNEIKPYALVLVKYEFWFNLMHTAHKQRIRMFLLSGVVRPGHIFNRLRGWFLKCFLSIEFYFLQQVASMHALPHQAKERAMVAGDTRFDRVLSERVEAGDLGALAAWCENKVVVVCGSSWPHEETLLSLWKAPDNVRLILAPHDVSSIHLQAIREAFPQSVYFSEILHGKVPTELDTRTVVVVNNVGYLSRIYSMGHVAVVGGGFRNALHNILEPAAFGIPVLFGARVRKFKEASDMVAAGGAQVITDGEALHCALSRLVDDRAHREAMGKANRKFVEDSAGATARVMEKLKKLQAI